MLFVLQATIAMVEVSLASQTHFSGSGSGFNTRLGGGLEDGNEPAIV